MVDAFRAWEFHFPPGIRNADDDMKSRLKSFVARVVDEIKPDLSTDELPPNVHADRVCQLELIDKTLGKKGKSKGKMLCKQSRCTMCKKSGRKMADGRATRTGYRCKAHPEVIYYVPPTPTHA
jgi:hypothetical protein